MPTIAFAVETAYVSLASPFLAVYKLSVAVVTRWSLDTRNETAMAERRFRLTKEVVDCATPRAAPYWDTALSGFGLRVGHTGTKTFFVRYRPKGTGRTGPKRFYTIGKYGPLTPDQARNRAKEVLGQVAAGQDPAVA